MLAGSGTYAQPYALNFTEDPLAKSLVILNPPMLKSRLPLFMDNLNTLLAKLSFYKFNRQAMADLDEVLNWIDLGNKSLFLGLHVKATLYLFENSYQKVEGGNFKQRRRSLPLEPLVFEAFPDSFKSLVRFIQCKLIMNKSELRMGLVFRRHDTAQKQRLE